MSSTHSGSEHLAPQGPPDHRAVPRQTSPDADRTVAELEQAVSDSDGTGAGADQARSAEHSPTASSRTRKDGSRQGATFDEELGRRAAELVEDQRALFAEAEEFASAGSWQYHPASGSLTWSPGMYHIRAADPSAEPLTLETATADVHPDDRARVLLEYAHGDPIDDNLRSAHRIIRPDGSVRHLDTRSRVERDADARVVRIVGVTVDVTDRGRAESKLPVARLGSWAWDIAAGSIAWSDPLCRIYGVEPGVRLSFAKFLALVHPDDRVRVESTLERACATLEPCSFEHRTNRRDGVTRVLQVRGEVITDEAAYAHCKFVGYTPTRSRCSKPPA